VLLEFSGCYAHLFGPPNDEAFSGHPLASRGLQPYRITEVKHSSWIAVPRARSSLPDSSRFPDAAAA
jgi:hypothetical protein